MKIDIAIGEVFDRITILDIKMQRITDSSRLHYVNLEKSVLLEALLNENIELEQTFYDALHWVNSKIWDTEAGFRDKEAKEEFDEEFIEFARLNAKYNDERFVIKRKINEHYNSEIREQKAYNSLYEKSNSN